MRRHFLRQGGRFKSTPFLPATADDSEFQARVAPFLRGLQQLGWTDGRNVRIDYPLGRRPMPTDIRRYAAELVALAPDVILASSTAAVAPLLQATRTVPIVFVHARRPGRCRLRRQPGAAEAAMRTGFLAFEYGISGKWLELLKQIAPGVTRVAVIRDPSHTAGTGQFGAIQAVAPSLGVEVSPVNVRDAGEIERAIAAFARSPNGGLDRDGRARRPRLHRNLIITLAARHKLPAVYYVALLRHRRRPDLLRA